MQQPIYEERHPDHVKEEAIPGGGRRKEAKSYEYLDDIRNKEFFTRKDLEPQRSKEDGYFHSLQHQYMKYMEPIGEKHEMERDNEINFVQAYQSPSGPMKYMSEAAKEKVHQEIDQRM